MPLSPQDSLQTDSGFCPLSVHYTPIRMFSGQQILLRSAMTIESPELGTLEPEQYRYVARRTSQSQQLFLRQLQKVLQQMPKLRQENPNVSAVTVPVYNRVIQKGGLGQILFDALRANPQVSAENLCLEVSADILFEELEPLCWELELVRNMGIRIALFEMGDPYCPLLRLGEVPYDYIFLDRYPLEEGREEEFAGLCRFLHIREKTKVIAADLDSDRLCSDAERLGCDGYSLRPDAPPCPEEEGDG